MPKLLLIVLLCSLYSLQTVAQDEQPAAESIQNKDHSFFKARLTYLSNNVYNGRKDSLVVPYLTPSLAYYHPSGLFAKTSVSFLVSSYAQRVDLVDLEAGYRFQVKHHFGGSVSAGLPFYNASSVSVLSQTKGEFSAGFYWDIVKAVTLNASAGYMLTTGMADKYINTGLSHEFSFGKDEAWSIEPSVAANFGTRNYYEEYKKHRRLKTGKSKSGKDSTVTGGGNGKVVVTTTVTSLDANQLVMLDSELSLAMYYDTGKWSFFATPTFAIPVNPAVYVTTITTDKTLANGTTTHNSRTVSATEQISNTFYMEVGVSYKF